MEKKISIEIEAVKVLQRPHFLADVDEFQKEHDFFVCTLSSGLLLRISKFLSRKESSLGIQRTHKEDRDKEIGRFITSEHPFFPNTIIINIPLEFEDKYYDQDKKTLKFEIEEHSAYVIDGQHRLKAFSSKYSEGVEFDLVVAAYFGLEPPTIAEIFTRINYFQKPVSKSLVYDLLDLNEDPEFIKYREAHKIASEFNDTISSPFYGLIKMLGVGSGLLSQAAFVESITTRYRIIELLSSSYSMVEKTEIIESYFRAIKESFPDRWGNPNSMLTRTVGFNALVKTLKAILSTNSGKIEIPELDFKQYTDVMKSIDVDSKDIRSFGGFKGVNALAEKFSSVLVKKGLL